MSIGLLIVLGAVLAVGNRIKSKIDRVDAKLDKLLIISNVDPGKKVDEKTAKKVEEILAEQGDISAIKYLISNTSLDLKEAKEYVNKIGV